MVFQVEEIIMAEQPGRVVIVGAGPAGLTLAQLRSLASGRASLRHNQMEEVSVKDSRNA
jgi:hypothetical protein